MERVPAWPIRLDIGIQQGDGYERLYGLRYRDETGAPQYLPTEDYTATMTIRETYDGPVIWAGTTQNARLFTGIMTDEFGTWNLQVRIPASETATLPAAFAGVWDLTVTPPGSPNDRRTLFAGSVAITPKVSV